MMLVMPEAIGAAALLVDKGMSRLNLGDLGEPARPHPTQWPKLVLDELPGVNSIPFGGGKNLEFHLGRGEEGKIGRIREKRPDLIERSRNELDAM